MAGEDSTEVLEDKVHIKIPEDSLHNAAYTIIAGGSFILVVGFCGCCGAIRESAFMLAVVSNIQCISAVNRMALCTAKYQQLAQSERPSGP